MIPGIKSATAAAMKIAVLYAIVRAIFFLMGYVPFPLALRGLTLVPIFVGASARIMKLPLIATIGFGVVIPWIPNIANYLQHRDFFVPPFFFVGVILYAMMPAIGWVLTDTFGLPKHPPLPK